MKEAPPPQARFIWRCVYLSFLFILGAGLVTLLHLDLEVFPPVVATTLVSLCLLLAWLMAVRFVLSDTWGRRIWLIWLGLTFVLVSTLGGAGLGVGIPLSVFFLTMRQFKPWRHLSSRERAWGFGLGILAVGLLIFTHRYWSLSEPTSWLLAAVRRLGGWSLWSLVCFWLWSMFHLAIRMRLHFLRLRPKLAVSAFLIGFVPLLLMLVLGLMIFYTGLGGARGQRAANLLEGWRRIADRGGNLSGAPFDTTFTWSLTHGNGAGYEVTPLAHLATTVVAPEWTPQLAAALKTDWKIAGDAYQDTTSWYLMGGDIWLMSWEKVGTENVRTRAWLLGQRPLERLSDFLKAGLDFSPIGSRGNEGERVMGEQATRSRTTFIGRKVSYRDVSDDPAYWDKFRYFGGTLFGVTLLNGEDLDHTSVFINLRVRWQDLSKEFLEGENNINLAVVISLAVVAGLFLILEIFALFFGVRITEGFVSAVHELDRGTKALTAGNLDTVIEIPNEDELGDLATSFNEMTKAIRQGREDALANERMTRELETAREIQERLLPSEEPRLKGFEVTGASIPSREIGGDYFDFLFQDDGTIGVAIGDVSGKGMPAALLMSNLQASLQGQVIHPSSVAEVVSRVNNLIVGSTDPHMFATFFYGLLDTEAGTFASTNAGHNPPMLLRAGGEIELLKSGGLLLGMVSGVEYRQETTTLAPGELVVLYTDGITEAVGPSAEEDDPEAMFGEEALEEVVRRNRHLPAVGIKEAILDAVSQHTQGVAQSDDITLVVIRRQG